MSVLSTMSETWVPAADLAAQAISHIIDKDPLTPRLPHTHFLCIPAEIRINIYQHLFSMVDFSIHVHDHECAEFCGDRRARYNNSAILFVSHQLRAESKPFFYSHGTFHVFKTAFHGHNYLPPMPTPVSIKITNLVCWSDVAYRSLTHNQELAIIGPLVGLQTVNFNVIWNRQHHRLSPDIKKYIFRDHRYAWSIDIKKRLPDGILFRMTIDHHKQVTILEKMKRFTFWRLEYFLKPLGLTVENVVNMAEFETMRATDEEEHE